MLNVLQVIGYLGRGGDTSVVLEVMEAMPPQNFKFDFLTHEGADEEIIIELRKKGSNVYILKGDVRELGPIKYYLEVRKIIATSSVKYDVIHTHTSMQSGIALMAAKHEGIYKRVCHSHVSDIQRRASWIKKKVAIPLLKFLLLHYSTSRIACSKIAGDFLFGKNTVYQILYNVVDVKKFISVEKEETEAFRTEIGCSENDILIGHVAHISTIKNHDFDLILADKLTDREDIKFIIVGKGNEFERIQRAAMHLKNRMIFTGQRNDIHILMKSFDCVILPSLPGEGFPVTIIEAQAAGCPCIISDKVTTEVEIGLSMVKMIPLNCVSDWVDEIKNIKRNSNIEQRNRIGHMMESRGYCKGEFVNKWLSAYKGELLWNEE